MGRRLQEKAYVEQPTAEPTSERRRLVSVVIPCFNYGRFLPQSVGSALSQQAVDVEVVVVDDASTDGSDEVAAQFAADDERVQLVRHRDNAGHVIAFNDGFAKASGDFIVRLDADDLLTPGALARAVALFEAFPSVGLVYGHPRHFTSATPPTPQGQLQAWRIWTGRAWLGERCRTGVNCITTPEAMIRGETMRAIGPLDTRLRHAQDMEMWFRVAGVSDVGRVEGPDQALHRDHPDSMSVTDCAGVLLDLRERQKVFELVFAGPAAALADAPELHQTARLALAAEALERACAAYDRGRAEVDVDELVDFASEICADSHLLPQWRAWQRRRRVGTRFSPFVPQFAASAAWRRLRTDARHRRWVRSGL